MARIKPKLMVYLPCHDDYELSLLQSKSLRNQISRLEKDHHLQFDLQILISINSDNYPKKSRYVSSDMEEIFSFGHGIAGDVNIMLGFVNAIYDDADFLWILLSKNQVSEEALETINRLMVCNDNVDLIVSGPISEEHLLNTKSIFDKSVDLLRFGLISSVVYRMSTIRSSVDMAIRLNWTGWGQLAIQEASCLRQSQLTIMAVPEKLLHAPQHFEGISRHEERLKNMRGYAHSYFGGPPLVAALHSHNKKLLKKKLNNWIKGNWYLRNFYRSGLKTPLNSSKSSETAWIASFCNGAIRDSSYYRFLFWLGGLFPYLAVSRIRDIISGDLR
jgi:hypothetical protein